MEKIYPSEIAGFISAIIIYMCAFVLLIKQQLGKARMRRVTEKKGGEAK